MNGPVLPALRATGLEGPILPSLPPGLPYLLAALGGEGMGSQELALELQRFPPIAGRVIALANCAWVSPPRPIVNLSDACAMLGLRVVRGVSIALALSNTFNASRCPNFNARRFWSSALLTAEGCGLLARKARGPTDPNTMATAGLLHNLGLLWMVDRWPAEASMALDPRENRGDLGLMGTLRLTTGTDYCEQGGLLGDAWKLPDELTIVMRHHRTPTYHGPHMAIAESVGAVASVVSALFETDDPVSAESDSVFPGLAPTASKALFAELVRQREPTGQLAKALIGDDWVPASRKGQ